MATKAPRDLSRKFPRSPNRVLLPWPWFLNQPHRDRAAQIFPRNPSGRVPASGILGTPPLHSASLRISSFIASPVPLGFDGIAFCRARSCRPHHSKDGIKVSASIRQAGLRVAAISSDVGKTYCQLIARRAKNSFDCRPSKLSPDAK